MTRHRQPITETRNIDSHGSLVLRPVEIFTLTDNSSVEIVTLQSITIPGRDTLRTIENVSTPCGRGFSQSTTSCLTEPNFVVTETLTDAYTTRLAIRSKTPHLIAKAGSEIITLNSHML